MKKLWDTDWDNNDTVLSTQQVMKLLSISKPTLYRWIAEQGLPVKKIGKNYRYRRSEVLRWFESKDVTQK